MILGGIEHHPSHPGCELKLKNIQRLYKCDGCMDLGLGTCYTCTNTACDFHLHEDCACPELTISHPFFPNLHFHFLTKGYPNRYCDACGKGINGYVYRCFEEDLDLHPCCAKLPYVYMVGEEMKLVLIREVSSTCYRCGEKKFRGKARSNWSYVSENQQGRLHISCLEEMFYASLKDGLEVEGSVSSGSSSGVLEEGSVSSGSSGSSSGVLERSVSSGSSGSSSRVLKKGFKLAIGVASGDPTSIVYFVTSLAD